MSTAELSKASPEAGNDETSKLVEHTGGCHCGAVRFKVKAAENLTVDKCNCSICHKKQISSFSVSSSDFTLLQGQDNITTYTFNTGIAKHMFCKICGVQSFYIPRSNPGEYSVMPHCLDPGTVKSMETEIFDGINWEETMRKLESESTGSELSG